MVVQGGLFKDISEPLHARIPQIENDKSGTWQRDSDSIVDVEWDVFAGLVEYAYTGDYARSIPTAIMVVDCPEDCSTSDECSVRLSRAKNEDTSELVPSAVVELVPSAVDELALEEPTEPLKQDWDYWRPSTKRDRRKGASKRPEEALPVQTLSESLWKHFIKQKLLIAEKQSVRCYDTPSPQNTAALLYHAKLCVLANRYMVDSLQHLCLEKLLFSLTNLEIKPQKIDNVLNLVEYVYLEEGVQGIPELREIVLLFTTAKLNVLRQDPRFRCMLEAIGTLGADIVYEIAEARNWR